MLRIIIFSLLIILVSPAWSQSTFQQVYDIMQAKCSSCHNPVDMEAGLDLVGTSGDPVMQRKQVYANLVRVSPENSKAAQRGDKRIYPGRADKSYLFRKINGGLESTLELFSGEGDVMPPSGSGYSLTDIEKEMIRQWILYGAPENGEVVDPDVIASYYTEGGQESFPSGPPPAPLPGEGFQIKMGPFFLEKGGEVEYFQKWALDLPEDVDVNRIDFQISNYSHHFILYYFENDGSGVGDGLRLNQNHSGIGLYAAVQEKTDLNLPEGTAFPWEKDIVLDLNSHYINYSFTQVYKAEVYLNVYTDPSGTAAQEMESVLIPNLSIFIPNDGTPRSFQRPYFGVGEIFLWGVMGHTHKYGTDYKVYMRNSNGSKGDLIYDASCAGGIPGCVSPYFDYQHIPMRYFSPLLPLRLSPGIIHEASYINDGPRSVQWGPTSEDEMMLMILMFTRDTAGIVTNTREIQQEEALLVTWPNPVRDILNISAKDAGNWSFDFYSLEGTRVRSGQVFLDHGIAELSLTDLMPGMYFYRFVSANGHIQTGNFIKGDY